MPCPLPWNKASDIDKLSHKGEKEKRHTFLIKWREVKGPEATYRNLIQALLTIESVEDAEEVCKLLLDLPPPLSSPTDTTGIIIMVFSNFNTV